jgi:hypothetical protein
MIQSAFEHGFELSEAASFQHVKHIIENTSSPHVRGPSSFCFYGMTSALIPKRRAQIPLSGRGRAKRPANKPLGIPFR